MNANDSIIRVIRVITPMDTDTQKQLLKLVQKNYDAVAVEFNKTRNKNSGLLWAELVKLSQQVKDSDKVLDIGCGNGRLLKILAGRNIDYLGVDSSANILKTARVNHPHNKFVCGDILELGQIPEINFDYVFCLAVLHHLPGKNLRVQALRQLKNKLNKNGKIIIAVWNMWPQHKFRKIIFKFALLKIIKKNKMDWGDIIFSGFSNIVKRYYHAFTKRELKKISRQAGLKIEKLYKDKFNYYALLKK